MQTETVKKFQNGIEWRKRSREKRGEHWRKQRKGNSFESDTEESERETASTSSPGNVYCQLGFGLIGSRDYLTLKHGCKITDEIINGMLHHQMKDRPDCYMFSSHFMSHYLRLTGSAEDKFQRVARWTRGVNLFAKNVICVPVFKDDHWYLLVAMDLGGINPSVTILNSIPGCGDDQQAAEALTEYLRVGFNVSGIRVYRPLLPTQATVNDCGAFVVLYQRHILEDTDGFKVNPPSIIILILINLCPEEARRRQSGGLVLSECGVGGTIQDGCFDKGSKSCHSFLSKPWPC